MDATRILTILAMCSLAACGVEGASIDGEPLGQSGREIVGGSSYAGLPAVGAILVDGQPWCTGTLIGVRKVLTAAHCLEDVSASQMEFALGTNASNPDTVLPVASIKANPSYNSYSITNDIGYLTLGADAAVAPLPVVASMTSSWVGTPLFFVGYGVTNGYNQSGAGKKRAVWMSISSVNSTQFEYNDTGKNTCNGDSGGPAFYKDPAGNYLVAGVTSYGDANCAQYGVDTRVDAFLSFLGITGGVGTGTGSSGGTDTGSGANTSDPCKGETFAGRCDGAKVIWCESNTVRTQDCSASGKTCIFDSANQYYACGKAPSTPVDPCNGESFTGRCENGSVIWCENQQVKSLTCSQSGKSCRYDSSKGYYNCL